MRITARSLVKSVEIPLCAA